MMKTTPINPFLYNTPIEAREMVTSNEEIISANVSGSFTRRVKTEERKKVDALSSVKLYRSKTIRQTLFSLSPKALQLHLFICMTLKKDEDMITINRQLFLSDTGLSIDSYNKAIVELINNSFITRHIGKTFWINPHLYFCGDRIGAILKKYGEKRVCVVNSR